MSNENKQTPQLQYKVRVTVSVSVSVRVVIQRPTIYVISGSTQPDLCDP